MGEKHHENMDLENKKESLRLLFYKILEVFFLYEGINNNKKHNNKTQTRVCHSLLSAKNLNSVQQ